MKLSDIVIRDPYILADPKTKRYYMYASRCDGQYKGFQVYESDDLTDWKGPFEVYKKDDSFWATDDFWAPEVHIYKGMYYLFGTFSSASRKRTSQILVASSARGPFRVYSRPLGPDDWYVLDATLYVENGVPYALYSREWLQDNDGAMCYSRLSDDLSAPVGEPVTLFKASQSGWAKSPCWNVRPDPIYIVDAPFVYEIEGRQFILWSSWSDADNSASYSVGVLYPEKGVLGGEYRHELLNLPKNDSGHAMIFKGFDNKDRICYHENNSENGREHAAVYFVGVKCDKVVVYEQG